MKKKHKKKHSNLFLKILFVIAILVVAAVLIVKYVDFDKIFNQTSTPEPTQTQTQKDPTPTPTPTPEPTPAPQPEPEPAPAPEPENKTPQYDGSNPNGDNSITGAITYANVSNGVLMIRINIDQYLSGGECNLILNQNGAAQYGATARIIDAASTSTCEGFNVPLNELDAGKYEIIININSERKTGTIVGEVSL